MDTIYLGYVNFNSFVCRPERDFDKGIISHNTGNIFSSKILKNYIYLCTTVKFALNILFKMDWTLKLRSRIKIS